MANPLGINGRATPSTALLEQKIDQTERAVERIAEDPEEALATVGRFVKAAPNVGEVTPADMFGLMSQMQAQMAGMQSQIIELMTGNLSGASQSRRAVDIKGEIDNDKVQREATLESWRIEDKEPVWLQPDEDEQKIYAVVGKFPPRIFRINGLEYPITVGEIAQVPKSVAVLVHHNQRRKPYQAPPQALGLFPDPPQSKFLQGGEQITIGAQGKTGEGRLIPDGLPNVPQELGIRYDHRGQ